MFKFNPSISFLVACRTKDEVDALWKPLSEGGQALMELGEYPFSGRYGWTQDKYGLSWQVMLMGNIPVGQKITPTLMFVGDQAGRAEEAIKLYTSIFPKSGIGDILRYGKGEEPDKEGTVKHAGFTLEGQSFAAMDSAHRHNFAFNEAVSLMELCETQARSTVTGRSSPRTEDRRACAAGSRTSSGCPGRSPPPAWTRCSGTRTSKRSSGSPTRS
jgi:predicted 3-demethylubiquinone-9 3-methyltransferase (glyoxalase superfamily)